MDRFGVSGAALSAISALTPSSSIHAGMSYSMYIPPPLFPAVFPVTVVFWRIKLSALFTDICNPPPFCLQVLFDIVEFIKLIGVDTALMTFKAPKEPPRLFRNLELLRVSY